MGRSDETPSASTADVANVDAAVTLQSWLQKGPFTLALSTGYLGWHAHCGALQVRTIRSSWVSPA